MGTFTVEKQEMKVGGVETSSVSSEPERDEKIVCLCVAVCFYL